MGLLNFLKNLFVEGKEESKKEEISLENLGTWLEEQKNLRKEQEKQIIPGVNNLILQLSEELKQELPILTKIDLKEKKEEEKLKIVVLQNLSYYCRHLENLIKDLETMEKSDFQHIIQQIDNAFLGFRKKSETSFQKSTFLVGQEIENVQSSIKNFFNNFKKIVEENKDSIEKSKVLDMVDTKLKELAKVEAYDPKRIIEIENQLKVLEDSKKIKEVLLKDIKMSPEYLEAEKERKQALLDDKMLENKIIGLRNIIDFKSLANAFHENEKKMQIINHYNEYILQTLEKPEELFSLLEEGKKNKLKNSIDEINKKKREIKDIIGKKDPCADINLEISQIYSSMEKLLLEKSREEKLGKKQTIAKETLKKEIKELLSQIKIVLK